MAYSESYVSKFASNVLRIRCGGLVSSSSFKRIWSEAVRKECFNKWSFAVRFLGFEKSKLRAWSNLLCSFFHWGHNSTGLVSERECTIGASWDKVADFTTKKQQDFLWQKCFFSVQCIRLSIRTTDKMSTVCFLSSWTISLLYSLSQRNVTMYSANLYTCIRDRRQ